MKKEQVMKTLRAYSMVIVLVVIAVLFHLLTNGLIFTAMNLTNIILQNSYVVLLILGMLPVILTGNVDLSVGSVLAFVGAIAAILQVNYHCGVLVTLLVIFRESVSRWCVSPRLLSSLCSVERRRSLIHK